MPTYGERYDDKYEDEQRLRNDAAFEIWMKKVDAYLYNRVGCIALDLPDWCYRDAFDDEMTPAEAAREALTEAGGYSMKVRISLGWIIAITAIVLLVALVNARLDQTRTWGKPAPTVCQEDDECWDCHAMGNNICGQETN